MTNCEHCIIGQAKYKCLECEMDEEECLMCQDCMIEHLDANPKQRWGTIVSIV